MGVLDLDEQIRKATLRASGLDLARLAADAREKTPRELSTPKVLDERRRFLNETMGVGEDSEETFERLIAGDELQPINYLEHGVVAARPVCRLKLFNPQSRFIGWATGFLIAPGILLTNHHVFPAKEDALRSLAEFDVELDVRDQDKTPVSFALRPDQVFMTSDTLDFSIVRVEPTSQDGGKSLLSYGYLPLISDTGKAAEGEWLTIIQHPAGGKKQVCVRENQLISRTDDALWYSTDTLGGSSGSPVFNNAWQVVALHHKGVPEMKNGVIQTIDGRDYDRARESEDAIKWVANEGIRISRVVAQLRASLPNEALLEPVFNMTGVRAKALLDNFSAALTEGAAPPPVNDDATTPEVAPAPAARSINLTLDIADDGRVSLRQPGSSATEDFTEKTAATPRARKRQTPPEYDIEFDTDYSAGGQRKGFDPAFLSARKVVRLPELGALAAVATPLIADPKKVVLNYRGYSVVMHKERKFAIYTAANIDGANRFALGRPHDEWRFDPRILRSQQIGGYYYENNKFDRGHLTRYEDMEYGSSAEGALRGAADTLHLTNCTPQHAEFNERKALWQGLETHLLEDAIKSSAFRAIVFTGPVLDEGDPVWERYKDIQYPLRFWKVAVALTDKDKLFAAGFVMDQSGVIAQFGVEATVEVPFTAFKTFQTPIAEIEALTGLAFKDGAGASLSAADPLRVGSAARRRVTRAPPVAVHELASATTPLPPGYVLLEDESDIIRG